MFIKLDRFGRSACGKRLPRFDDGWRCWVFNARFRLGYVQPSWFEFWIFYSNISNTSQNVTTTDTRMNIETNTLRPWPLESLVEFCRASSKWNGLETNWFFMARPFRSVCEVFAIHQSVKLRFGLLEWLENISLYWVKIMRLICGRICFHRYSRWTMLSIYFMAERTWKRRRKCHCQLLLYYL